MSASWRPVFEPEDKIAAMLAIADVVVDRLKDDVPLTARAWLRDALRARAAGRVATLDAALGLRPPQLRTARAGARHALIRELAASTGLAEPWAAAGEVQLILEGTHEPSPAGREACEKLRSDPECARTHHGLYRILTDAKSEVRVSRRSRVIVEMHPPQRRKVR